MSSAPDATDSSGRPGGLTTIKAVPVRHPGRWVAAAIVLVIAVALVALGGHQPATSSGASVGNYLFDSRILHGVAADDRADRRRAWRRHRARHAAGGDAPVAEPDRVRRELAVHLVLPRHAGARAAAVLVQHRGAVPDDRRSAIPFGPAFVHVNANTLITPFVAVVLGARPQRGRLHGRDRARRHHLGRRGPDRGGAVARA